MSQPASEDGVLILVAISSTIGQIGSILWLSIRGEVQRRFVSRVMFVERAELLVPCLPDLDHSICYVVALPIHLARRNASSRHMRKAIPTIA